MSRRSGEAPVGHLELKPNGCWYIVVRTKSGYKGINTRMKDKAGARCVLEKFLDEERWKIEERRDAIPLAKVWAQYEGASGSGGRDGRMNRRKRSAWFEFAEWMQIAHPEADDAAKVTADMANGYMNRYREKHAASTCNNIRKFLVSMFNALLRDGIVHANPWLHVRRFPKDSFPRRELSAAEIGKVLSEADAAGGEWHSLMAVGLYTGLRLGDCCTLAWRDVDLKRRIIQVVPGKTKRYSGRRPVTIPIHPRLARVFERTPADGRTGYVLGGMAAMYLNHYSTLEDGIRRIFNAAGIETSIMIEGRSRPTPYATFHSLRHSFVSFAANSGVPIAIVQSIVGHRSTAMTCHYYHAGEEALRKAVDAIPDFENSRVARKAPHAATPVLHPARPLGERMKEAANLFGEGVITEDEFNALRRRILESA